MTTQPLDQSSNQSVDQSANQSTSQSTDESINQSTNQSTIPLIKNDVSNLGLHSRFRLTDTVTIPRLGFGTWRSHLTGDVIASVSEALRVGYRHFDCAWTYENEAAVGEGLKAGMIELGLTRKDIFLTSKVWNNQLKGEDVSLCVNQSISRLESGYLDLLLIHWPVPWKKIDGNKFAENADKTDRFYEDVDVWTETWQAMEKLVDDGLVRAIGVSNCSINQISHLRSICRIQPVCDQIECHPYFQQPKLEAYLQSVGMALVAYSPLGNVDPEDSHRSPLHDPLINQLAHQHCKTPAQIILRWHLQRGHVVIPKSVKPARIAENAMLYDFSLSDSEMAQIAELNSKNIRFINPPWLPKWTKYFDVHSDE